MECPVKERNPAASEGEAQGVRERAEEKEKGA